MNPELVAEALLFSALGAAAATALALLADWLERRWPTKRGK